MKRRGTINNCFLLYYLCFILISTSVDGQQTNIRVLDNFMYRNVDRLECYRAKNSETISCHYDGHIVSSNNLLVKPIFIYPKEEAFAIGSMHA